MVRDFRLGLDQCADVGLDLGDIAVENLDETADTIGHGVVVGLTAPVLLLSPHDDELIPPSCFAKSLRIGLAAGSVVGRMARAKTATCVSRSDRSWRAGRWRAQSRGPRAGLIRPKRMPALLRTSRSSWPQRHSARASPNVLVCVPLAMPSGTPRPSSKISEMLFGDGDSDATKGYDHSACPCNCEVCRHSLVQLFRWKNGTSGRQSRLTASSAKNPTASRPPHPDRLPKHRDRWC